MAGAVCGVGEFAKFAVAGTLVGVAVLGAGVGVALAGTTVAVGEFGKLAVEGAAMGSGEFDGVADGAGAAGAAVVLFACAVCVPLK